jgi:hypothetical protein
MLWIPPDLERVSEISTRGFNMWPFKKKTDLERAEAHIEYFQFMVECEQKAVDATKRELAKREANLALFQRDVRMGKSLVATLREIAGGEGGD